MIEKREKKTTRGVGDDIAFRFYLSKAPSHVITTPSIGYAFYMPSAALDPKSQFDLSLTLIIT